MERRTGESIIQKIQKWTWCLTKDISYIPPFLFQFLLSHPLVCNGTVSFNYINKKLDVGENTRLREHLSFILDNHPDF